MRLAASLAVVAVLGYLAFRVVFGVAGGIVGILLALAWFALKILLVAGLIYWLLSVFSPETAKKVRDSFRGESL